MSGTAITPAEGVKIKMQFQRKLKKTAVAEEGVRLYKGPVDCLTHTFKTEGVRGLFSGYAATILR